MNRIIGGQDGLVKPSDYRRFLLALSFLVFVFGKRVWIGRGDGGTICGSTGRESRSQQRNQRISAPVPSLDKHTALLYIFIRSKLPGIPFKEKF
jgi:hypothetical protein